MTPSRRRIDRVTINLASMIDVSFLILFYFMVASMLEDRETRLSAGLQTQTRGVAAASDFQMQTIEVRSINAVPAYVLGSRTLPDRHQLAEALVALPKERGVFVKVFDDVPVGFAAAAVQVARDAGFEQVTYVAAQ